MAIKLVSNSKDFRSILIENMYCYDTSKDTAEQRVKDWLWESKDNRVIGRDPDPLEEVDINSNGIESVINQISNFSDKLNKMCMAFYLISRTDNLPSDIHLSTNSPNESLNNDNDEVNKFIDETSVKWNNYSDTIYKEQISLLSKLLGSDVIEDIERLAPASLANEQIGPLEKQLRARGFTNNVNWDTTYDKVKLIKRYYRENLRGKELKIYSDTPLHSELSYDEYLVKVNNLKKSIVFNIESSGGSIDVII